jgi:hypothetical protein
MSIAHTLPLMILLLRLLHNLMGQQQIERSIHQQISAIGQQI